MELTEALVRAVRDYRFLLDRGYPGGPSRSLVGDRYRLTRSERAVLYRGVHSSSESERREIKRCAMEAAWPRALWVDTLNVVYTVAAYRQGRPVFIATDGWLRDAGEAHGAVLAGSMFDEVIALLDAHLSRAASGNGPTVFLVDEHADIAQELASGLISSVHMVMDGRAVVQTSASVDRQLVDAGCEVVATSDSQIIDRCAGAACDLPRDLLETRFKKQFKSGAEIVD